MRENKTSVWNEIFYLKQRVKFIWILDQSENSAIPLNGFRMVKTKWPPKFFLTSSLDRFIAIKDIFYSYKTV